MKTRIAYSFGLLSTALGALVLAGCPEDVIDADAAMVDAPISTDDAAAADDAGRDAARGGDTGASCGTVGNVGGSCAAAMCFEPWTCQEEVTATRPSIRRDGSPGRALTIRYFPGGLCEGSCDPNLNGQCNSCSTCLSNGVDGTTGAETGSCYQTCSADIDGRGGCNPGYGCNRAYLACVPECQIVAGVDTCHFSFVDDDDNPSTAAVIYDEGADYASSCNVATGLCERTGRAGATAGDDCEDDFDCEDDGTCLSGDTAATPVTLRDGYCIRLGCNETDLACQTGDVCTQSLFGMPGGVCMQGCVVGAETTDEQRVGLAGHNPGCGEGESCFWSGVHGASAALNGGCYPGNYNAVPAYNVGAECQTDAECWSPFGLGRCLFGEGNTLGDRVGRGICAVGGCGGSPVGLAVAGGAVTVPDPNTVCQTSAGTSGANNDICVNFSDTQSFCLTSCTAASECPTGYACPTLGGTPIAPLRLCWPSCMRNADCREGASCLNDSRGACNPDTDSCTCTDAAPRPDAGVLPRDAGTDAYSAPDAFVVGDDAAVDEDDAFTP